MRAPDTIGRCACGVQAPTWGGLCISCVSGLGTAVSAPPDAPALPEHATAPAPVTLGPEPMGRVLRLAAAGFTAEHIAASMGLDVGAVRLVIRGAA